MAAKPQWSIVTVVRSALLVFGCVLSLSATCRVSAGMAMDSLRLLGDEMIVASGNSNDFVAWLEKMREPALVRTPDGVPDPELLEAWTDLICNADLVRSMVMMEDKRPLRLWLELMTRAGTIAAIGGHGGAAASGNWIGRMTDPMVISTIVYSEDVAMMNQWTWAMGNRQGLGRILDTMDRSGIESLMSSMTSSMETVMAVFGNPIDGPPSE